MNIPVALLLPIVVMAVFFIAVARLTLYRPRYELPQVIQFVRKLDVVELSNLFNPDEEWALRELNIPKKFRSLQRERIRLALEYLRRLAHNADVIQSWALDLREELASKEAESFTIQERLVCELVQISTELRIYSIVARIKLATWVMFRMHLLPLKCVPRVAGLRIIGNTDIVKKYRALIDVMVSLTETYGETYSRQILGAMS